MKKIALLMVLVIYYILIPIDTAYAQYSTNRGLTGNINIIAGKKKVNSNDWSPTDSLSERSIQFDLREYYWPISLCIAYSKATDNKTVDILGDNSELALTISELDLGIKKIFSNPYGMNFSISGGLATITANAEMSIDSIGSVNKTDTGLGIWIGGDVYYTFCNVFNVGMNIKYSTAQVDFGSNTNVRVGGTHYGVLLGYHF